MKPVFFFFLTGLLKNLSLAVSYLNNISVYRFVFFSRSPILETPKKAENDIFSLFLM